MNYIREVAEKADIRSVIERYTDIRIRGQKFSCPFHGKDAHPSASLRKNGRWACFACGKSGDAVDFVSAVLGLSPKDAAQTINDDFGLGVAIDSNHSVSYEERRQQELARRNREEQRAKKDAKRIELTQLHREYAYALVHFAPKSLDEFMQPDPRFVAASKGIDKVSYELDAL